MLETLSPGDLVEHSSRPGKRLMVVGLFRAHDGREIVEYRELEPECSCAQCQSGAAVYTCPRSFVRPVLHS